MAYDYDALYGSTPDALGAPSRVFVDFFQNYDGVPLRVLDVGCGQGRDALFIARLGHSVVGVDLSPHGIADLNVAAKAENLQITGIAADISAFDVPGTFDVILIDRTLHMLDRQDRIAVLKRLVDHVAGKGWVLIADERKNMPDFRDVCAQHSAAWAVTLDKGGTLFLHRD
jgi:SAM-dependent methyltransferase